MVNKQSKTIFSKFQFTSSKRATEDHENRKVSYWLEKLHIQREQIRKDNKRGDEQLQAKKVADFTQSGINEHVKNFATKNEADKQMVTDLTKKSNRLVISISSVFPWDLFPDTIDVEESRVTFRFNQFLTSQSHSVEIRDISNVFIENSIFFATLQVVSRNFIQNDMRIGKLHKDRAKKVQRVIEGLRAFMENKVNTSNYGVEELIAKIDEFHTRYIT